MSYFKQEVMEKLASWASLLKNARPGSSAKQTVASAKQTAAALNARKPGKTKAGWDAYRKAKLSRPGARISGAPVPYRKQ